MLQCLERWAPLSVQRDDLAVDHGLIGQLRQSGLYLNLAPPSAASYISPPLMIEKEAMPFS